MFCYVPFCSYYPLFLYGPRTFVCTSLQNSHNHALFQVCETSRCDKEDLIDVLKEMDRRYFLVGDLKWEFEMLDRNQKGAISESDARFLFKMVHGEFFSQRRWNKFLNSRAAKGSNISFAEIEVDLCDIPTMGWIEEILEEEEEERRGTTLFSSDSLIIRGSLR